MELKRKPEQQDASISDKLSTGGFWKKPRMSCIPVTEHHVFHFDFPDSEESFDLEEDESSSDHDEVGESDAEYEAVSSKKSSTSCGFRPRTRCFAVRDFPTLLSGNPADVPAEPHGEKSEPEEDDVPAEPHDEESEPEEDDVPAKPHYEESEPEEDDVPAEPHDEKSKPEEDNVPAEPHDEESEPEEDNVPAEPHEEESEPEEDELDDGVDEAHMDMSDEESDVDESPEDTDVDESPEVVDVIEVESRANFDVDIDQDGVFNADESEHDNKYASSESSVDYIRRPRCSVVRDFPTLLSGNPADVPAEPHDEESEPEEDELDNGVDEAHMDISDEESDVDESPEDTDVDESPEDTDVDESPEVVDVVEVESQSNFDVDIGDFNADESEHDNHVASSEPSVKYIRRPRCSAVRDFPPGLLQNPQPVAVREEEEVEPVEDDYSEGADESVVIDPSADDSDVDSDETQSDLEVNSNEDDYYKLVEAEDDEADLSGYITCL